MIKNLALANFRNFGKLKFEFGEGITVINAPNAKGKTNILESISMLSTGKSFKARREQEIIKYNEGITSITGLACRQAGITSNEKLEIKVTTGENDWPKKKLLVNGISRRMIDFAGNLKTVLFLPEDLDLVTSAPTLRRRFLDTVLSQVDREYRRAIGSYEKGIRQRNRLLLRIREENISRSHLLFWNQLLIKNGNYITEKREELINNTNKYKCQINKFASSEVNTNYQLEYDRSVISDGRLEQYKDEEIASATTLVGPHRDDFVFLKDEKNMASFSSRGEQRMSVLWLKLAELAFVEEKTGEKPTLLLDDIFSELDHEHRKIVLDSILDRQVIITSADEHNLQGLEDKKLKIINL